MTSWSAGVSPARLIDGWKFAGDKACRESGKSIYRGIQEKHMPVVEFENKTFVVDEDGHLKDFRDWCPEWVEYVRIDQGIKALTEEHWNLIRILQDYFRENGSAPMARILSKAAGLKMKRIFELFPKGPGKGACKIAGLPKPKGCV
jgi:tRNA 2-thiouridine synthesizing protein E